VLRAPQVSKDFDGVLSSRSTKELDSILDSNVTLHKGARRVSLSPLLLCACCLGGTAQLRVVLA